MLRQRLTMFRVCEADFDEDVKNNRVFLIVTPFDVGCVNVSRSESPQTVRSANTTRLAVFSFSKHDVPFLSDRSQHLVGQIDRSRWRRGLG